MKNRDDICVIVQARLGSQRIPQKMIKPFAGTTLTDICLDKILDCKEFKQEQFFLSAWEPELKNIAVNKGSLQVCYSHQRMYTFFKTKNH